MEFKKELDRVHKIYKEKGYIEYTDVIDLNKEESIKNYKKYKDFFNNSKGYANISFIDDLTISNNDKRVMLNIVKYNLSYFDDFFAKFIEIDKPERYKVYIPVKKGEFYHALKYFIPILSTIPYSSQNKFRIAESNDMIVFRFYSLEGVLKLNEIISSRPEVQKVIGDNPYLKKFGYLHIMDEYNNTSYMSFVSDILEDYFGYAKEHNILVNPKTLIDFLNNVNLSFYNEYNYPLYELKRIRNYFIDVINGKNTYQINKDKLVKKDISFITNEIYDNNNIKNTIMKLLIYIKEKSNNDVILKHDYKCLNTISDFIIDELKGMDLNLNKITYSYFNGKYILKDKNNKKILEFCLKKTKEINYYDEFNIKTGNKSKMYSYLKINDTIYDINKPVSDELLNEKLENGLTTYTSITKSKKSNYFIFKEYDLNGNVITKNIQANNKTIYEEHRMGNDNVTEKIYNYRILSNKIDKKLISSRNINNKKQ